LQETYPKFQAQNVEIIAISVDDLGRTRQMAALTGSEYYLLADPEKTVTRAYGVFDLLGDGVAAPAVFILGSDAVIEWQYVGLDAGDRPTASQISGRLAAISD
jgi:peroxiredoxin